MQQFEASAFNTVGRWYNLNEVDSERASHNYIVLAIILSNIIKFGEDVAKF